MSTTKRLRITSVVQLFSNSIDDTRTPEYITELCAYCILCTTAVLKPVDSCYIVHTPKYNTKQQPIRCHARYTRGQALRGTSGRPPRSMPVSSGWLSQTILLQSTGWQYTLVCIYYLRIFYRLSPALACVLRALDATRILLCTTVSVCIQ